MNWNLIGKIGLIAALCSLLGIPLLGGGQTATIRVTSYFETDMMYFCDPMPEPTPRPEPVYETFTVRAGDCVYYDQIRVKSVMDDRMTVRLPFTYAGNSYVDEHSVREYDVSEEFTFYKGEKLVLYEVGLCDASAGITIIWDDDAGEIQ